MSDLPLFETTADKEIKELKVKIEDIKKLLKVAACPLDCVNGVYLDLYDQPIQCQFCYERGEILDDFD